MDNSVPHPVVRSGAAVGQDSDAHEEDAVSSQVKGHPLVSPNADDSQIMNAVRSDAWWVWDCWREASRSSLSSDMGFAVWMDHVTRMMVYWRTRSASICAAW